MAKRERGERERIGLVTLSTTDAEGIQNDVSEMLVRLARRVGGGVGDPKLRHQTGRQAIENKNQGCDVILDPFFSSDLDPGKR